MLELLILSKVIMVKCFPSSFLVGLLRIDKIMSSNKVSNVIWEVFYNASF